MNVLKTFMLILIFGTSSLIGLLFSKKYSNRVNCLKEINNCLNIFLTKIKYTYNPIPEIFDEISRCTYKNVSNLFLNAKNLMKTNNAGDAWLKALENCNLEINLEDKNILKGMSKLLGKTSIEGQISEIQLTQNFITKQINKAENEKQKNEKLYKTLGMTVGLAIVILLI